MRINVGRRNASTAPEQDEPPKKTRSLHQLRCVDGSEMAGRAMLEKDEAPVSASIELAEQREIELGLDRCGWFGLVCGSGAPRIACGSSGFGVACASSRFGAFCGRDLRGALANCSSFGAIARGRLGIEVGAFVDDDTDSTVAAPRREIFIACIGNRRIIRFRNRCLLEEIRVPTRSLALVRFPKPRKAIAERDVLALTTKRCLSLHHDQTWSLTPS